MNELTVRIKRKGYRLNEFLKEVGFSLRWYRMHEKPDSPKHEQLKSMIDELEKKHD